MSASSSAGERAIWKSCNASASCVFLRGAAFAARHELIPQTVFNLIRGHRPRRRDGRSSALPRRALPKAVDPIALRRGHRARGDPGLELRHRYLERGGGDPTVVRLVREIFQPPQQVRVHVLAQRVSTLLKVEVPAVRGRGGRERGAGGDEPRVDVRANLRFVLRLDADGDVDRDELLDKRVKGDVPGAERVAPFEQRRDDVLGRDDEEVGEHLLKLARVQRSVAVERRHSLDRARLAGELLDVLRRARFPVERRGRGGRRRAVVRAAGGGGGRRREIFREDEIAKFRQVDVPGAVDVEPRHDPVQNLLRAVDVKPRERPRDAIAVDLAGDFAAARERLERLRALVRARFGAFQNFFAQQHVHGHALARDGVHGDFHLAVRRRDRRPRRELSRELLRRCVRRRFRRRRRGDIPGEVRAGLRGRRGVGGVGVGVARARARARAARARGRFLIQSRDRAGDDVSRRRARRRGSLTPALRLRVLRPRHLLRRARRALRSRLGRDRDGLPSALHRADHRELSDEVPVLVSVRLGRALDERPRLRELLRLARHSHGFALASHRVVAEDARFFALEPRARGRVLVAVVAPHERALEALLRWEVLRRRERHDEGVERAEGARSSDEDAGGEGASDGSVVDLKPNGQNLGNGKKRRTVTLGRTGSAPRRRSRAPPPR
eukprot:31185-Pelagococcus_subviridis.AAC.4